MYTITFNAQGMTPESREGYRTIADAVRAGKALMKNTGWGDLTVRETDGSSEPVAILYVQNYRWTQVA